MERHGGTTAALLLLALAGCHQPGSTTCSDGRTCPEGRVCAESRGSCVLPEQLAECVDRPEGDPCSFVATAGVCRDGVCIDHCGDGEINFGEQCEQGLSIDVTCVDRGFDRGSLSCSDQCVLELDACGYTGWREMPVPLGLDFLDIAMLTDDSGWMTSVAGGVGAMHRWTGTTWAPETVPDGGRIILVATSGPTHSVGIGKMNQQEWTLFEHDGTSWSTVPGPEIGDGVALRDLFVNPAGDVFVHDSAGLLHHHSNGDWTSSSMGAVVDDSTVTWMSPEGPVIAAVEGGPLRAYDGESWSDFVPLPPAECQGLYPLVGGSSIEDFWFGGWPASLCRFTSSEGWRVEASPPQVTQLWASAPDQVYALTWSGVYRYVGSHWILLEVTLDSISPEIIVGFSRAVIGVSGGIFDDRIWQSHGPSILPESPAGTKKIVAVAATASNRALALRWDNQLLQWDGSAWTELCPVGDSGCPGPTNFGAVDMGLLGDGSVLLDWGGAGAGTRVTQVDAAGMVIAERVSNTPNDRFPRALWAGDSRIVVVGLVARSVYVGDDLSNPDHWDVVANVDRVWNDVDGRSIGDVIAVGETPGGEGAMSSFDGSVWTELDIGVVPALTGIWMDPASDGIFVVGQAGTVLEFDGSSWVAHSPPTAETFAAVDGTSTEDVVAVTRGREIWRYDGVEWTEIRSRHGGHEDVATTPGATFFAGDLTVFGVTR